MALLEDVNVEEASEEPMPSLTPFLRDEDVKSEEDDLPISKVEKTKKATTKPTKVAS